VASIRAFKSDEEDAAAIHERIAKQARGERGEIRMHQRAACHGADFSLSELELDLAERQRAEILFVAVV